MGMGWRCRWFEGLRLDSAQQEGRSGLAELRGRYMGCENWNTTGHFFRLQIARLDSLETNSFTLRWPDILPCSQRAR
jgi:hypothetical protein